MGRLVVEELVFRGRVICESVLEKSIGGDSTVGDSIVGESVLEVSIAEDLAVGGSVVG